MVIAAVTLGMYIWDICISLKDDYELLVLLAAKAHPFPTFVYFVARWTTLGTILTTALQVIPTSLSKNCVVLGNTSSGFGVIALGSITFLFFLRFRGVYHDSRSLTILFFAIWLGNLGCACMAAFIWTKPYSVELAGSTYCSADGFRIPYASIAVIGPLVHDTCVFLAISYRLFQNSVPSSAQTKSDLRTYVLGKNLPRLHRVLFIDGQVLYLITVLGSTSATILLYIPSIPQPYRLIIFLPQIALTSSVGCRVFRDTRLEKMVDQDSNLSLPLIRVSRISQFNSNVINR
ncbi:hypothetical protein K435DRAFT_900670 [Dendrothele bispora CBS 962.96]|uniref:Glucose receptor Git3 N-terminal domain-containing protein n=1 Tax=Dendrothele bispora (strain CBS 962.96) TaxID=1314807 RepID=A0A4S8LXH1_DENBC|nr:hypothetical protein K435DRAFT_900670 [Dendrothele bispora CBS 962.96]